MESMYFGAPQGMGTGTQFNNGNIPKVKVENNLTAEEIQRLTKQQAEFTLALSEESILRGRCNHFWTDGSDATEVIGDNKLHCKICNAEFYALTPDTDPASIKEQVDATLSILQSIKYMYITMPKPVAAQFWTIIPLLEKVPDLFKLAATEFTRIIGANTRSYNGGVQNSYDMYRSVVGALGGNMNAMNMMGMGGMDMSYGQPGAANPFAGNVNGMNAGGYAANTTNFQFNNGMMGGATTAQPTATGDPNVAAAMAEMQKKIDELQKQVANQGSAEPKVNDSFKS